MTLIDTFREAMADLASAVYVITTRDEYGRPRGFTATSVIPHGSQPPSVIISIDRGAFSHDAVTSGSHFGLNLLSEHQQHVAELFASKRPDKFDKTTWRTAAADVPVLSTALGSAVCRIERTLSHGDHTLAVGIIEDARMADGDALVYWQRNYHASNETPPGRPDTRPTTRRDHMPTTTRPTREALLRAVNGLVPRIRERAHEAETTRTVHAETIEDLRSAGVFRVFQPARYGGYEMDWGIQIDLARAVGAACGSTAWLVAVLSTHSAMIGRFAQQAQDDVWKDDADALVATGSARVGGAATPVEGGYMLDGAWRFSSGIDFSEWVMVAAPVAGVDAPPPAGLRQFLIPATEYEVIDDWHVSGLKATGSKQVKVPEPIFVPEHRTLGFLELLGADPPGAEVNEGYVYRMEFGPYFGTILLGPVLGIAEGALEEYLDATRVRIGTIRGNRVADAETVQLRVARSSAEISAAGLLLDRMLETLHDRAANGRLLTPRERVESMRDRAFITRTCADALHRLVRQMGAIGLVDGNPVQRQFRDITAASAQIGLNWDRNMQTYGKWALGVPTGDRAIDGELPVAQEDPSDSVG